MHAIKLIDPVYENRSIDTKSIIFCQHSLKMNSLGQVSKVGFQIKSKWRTKKVITGINVLGMVQGIQCAVNVEFLLNSFAHYLRKV